MVFVTEAFLFHRARIVGVCTNSDLDPSRCFLWVKLVSLVYYIPIGAVSSAVLHIDQGGVLTPGLRAGRFRTSGHNTPEDLIGARCLLLAQSGHGDHVQQCPLSGVKRTSGEAASMSANDPKRI